MDFIKELFFCPEHGIFSAYGLLVLQQVHLAGKRIWFSLKQV